MWESLCCFFFHSGVECFGGFASKGMNSRRCHIFDSQDIDVILMND